MGSFASKFSLRHDHLPYLAACILTSAGLACASDDPDTDTDTSKSEETQTSETKSDGGQEPAKSDGPDNPDAVGPESSAEAQAARDEAANPGSASVTRFDGNWKGTTSQDKAVSFKILNRFVGHAEIAYALEGDGCSADPGEIKFSAMNGTRMGAFTLMYSTDSAKLTLTGKFTSDDAAEGEYTVEVIGDAPEGCEPSVQGTWQASK